MATRAGTSHSCSDSEVRNSARRDMMRTSGSRHSQRMRPPGGCPAQPAGVSCGPSPLQYVPMSILSRRSFLAASAAIAAARPAFGALPGDVDIAVVGAGAAGIAAARRIVAARRRCVLLEASEQIGGRCITDTRPFGVPWDRGAHWIHTPDINPLAKLGRQTGLDIYPAPPAQKVRRSEEDTSDLSSP